MVEKGRSKTVVTGWSKAHIGLIARRLDHIKHLFDLIGTFLFSMRFLAAFLRAIYPWANDLVIDLTPLKSTMTTSVLDF